jgi:chromosome segregation protein
VQELREKLDRFGPVNHEAIEELEVMEEREDFLSAQFSDLTSARNSLSAIIKKLDEICKTRFEETFQQVRKNFQAIFRKLFGGGKADLILEAPPEEKENPIGEGLVEGAEATAPEEEGKRKKKVFDPLEAGVDVHAQPPGKKPKSISLLSGGEKAMTTIALIFALFKSRPSPFCILDEVDAPLDDSNIGRFVTMLQEFLAGTQFLVITHNKNTMAQAACLYGVTQVAQGVSRMISVNFEQIEEKDLVGVGG